MYSEVINNNEAKKYIDLTTVFRNTNFNDVIDYGQVEISNINIDKYYLFVVDIDDFKVINNFYGYIYGNKILAEISQRLKDNSGDNSTVCYSGSNRFLIFNFTALDIDKLAAEILNSIRKVFLIEKNFINLTATVGACSAYKHEKLDKVLQKADIAINKAKTNGKDCFVIYKEEHREELYKNIKIEENLRRAIKNEVLEIYYQPKINTKNEEVIGAEALLRWKDEEFGSIPPTEFIEIAERTGLIIDVGRFVINKVCKQMSEWENNNLKYKKVSINLSSKQFKDDKLPQYIRNKLNEFNLPPDSIELEITESAFIENKERNYEFIEELLEENIEIAIDDFGTGYSSYNQLSNFSLNTLKIDKSFIDFISFDNRKRLIVKNIIELAHILEMKVVAEGVELKEQAKILKEYGCDIIQGYYYSRPLCVADFEKYIKKEGNR